METLIAQDVTYVYRGKYQNVQALTDVSCTFSVGKFYAIVGQSGSGKTTLLSILGALATPAKGKVLLDGKDIQEIGAGRYRRENVSMIFQNFNLLPTLSILENVMFPMRMTGTPRKEAREKAVSLLEAVGLGKEEIRKLPAMLSGGQQQRVAIARALASQARFILADEPTGNLDVENGQRVVDLLRSLVKEGYCVIVITHDLGIARQADVIYQMVDGHLSEEMKSKQKMREYIH